MPCLKIFPYMPCVSNIFAWKAHYKQYNQNFDPLELTIGRVHIIQNSTFKSEHIPF